MASSMAATSTDDIGFADEILREDEMDMRLELDMDDCEDRADATEDEGEVDRGVEMSELMMLAGYEAIACANAGKERDGRRGRQLKKKETVYPRDEGDEGSEVDEGGPDSDQLLY